MSSTGRSLRAMCLSKLAADTAVGCPENRALWQRPHLAFAAGLSRGTRLVLSQWGQTICRPGVGVFIEIFALVRHGCRC